MALIRRIVVAALPLFLFIAPARVEARPIALAWDANREPEVTGYTVSYTATNLPGGLTINASTGRISGIISAGAAASSPYLVSASASNAVGNKSSIQFTWTVGTNAAPSLTNPGNRTSAQNTTVSLQL